jgi:hypothetical protein
VDPPPEKIENTPLAVYIESSVIHLIAYGATKVYQPTYYIFMIKYSMKNTLIPTLMIIIIIFCCIKKSRIVLQDCKFDICCSSK